MSENMNVTRRTLLQASAAGACTLALGGIAASGAQAHAQETAQVPDGAGVQYGFLVGLSRCSGCGRCVEACRKHNKLSEDTPDRRSVSSYRRSRGREFFVSTSCMHCAEPSCMSVCPAGAISKDSSGVVRVDAGLCIGCKYCYQACPYEVPRYNSVSMDKCDCCLGSGVPLDEDPYCVRACKFGALRFGPLQELMDSTNGSAVPIAQANDPSCLLLGTEK
ncbi:4Fe-4S dicluster domain-containing protein [Paraeggerthella hongkongensis]|uniref:4Fe-4S ferredoxin n=1 Tax=Paraeggerthella hongkongensis TaxID=230658 RepID=A0A3N0AV42_9ACTN|nr:4Fe-4S dicluster domain-containing protein [Paraeggerthella hongkongensis]RNL38520.1 4Fe-4S ferredoxin [Paraeggerthella hongkongensis]